MHIPDHRDIASHDKRLFHKIKPRKPVKQIENNVAPKKRKNERNLSTNLSATQYNL
jgi:hypothetical protein